MRIPILAFCGLLAACSAKVPGGSDGGFGPTTPNARFLPQPVGTCPQFTDGVRTFQPSGFSRNVVLYVSDQASTLHGPLVFFWHGAGGEPSDVTYVLGPALKTILDLGGVVAAPYHDDNAGALPWYLSGGGTDDTDLRLADEILGCAQQAVGIDVRHIHSVGFSAGAMHNTQFVAFRSGYLASIVNYSGARLSEPDEQDPRNKYAAMLFYGGPDDQVLVNFDTETHNYYDALTMEGHFAFMCDHNLGHEVPEDGRAAAWQFLLDHPFGVQPEPYANALPDGFPSYCSLSK